ncbi:MAG TPA: GNAT family N-acetyltransferase [Steroidobacteraceae bacterium]|nr:GNAT family N-acetyltransferase [Steroidobacteraceae bacterium]
MTAASDRRAQLRRATPADLDFVVATERLPGYEQLTARWTPAEHAAALGREDAAYLVGSRPGGALEGFAILQPLNDPHEGAKLKRICVTRPGAGFGRPFLVAVIDWVFSSTGNERLWLDVFTHNERARHVYRQVGLREDGLLRQAYRMPDGSRADRCIMSVLRQEWRAP